MSLWSFVRPFWSFTYKIFVLLGAAKLELCSVTLEESFWIFLRVEELYGL